LKIEPLEDRRLLAVDFGDAPDPYPTTLADDGARHEAVGPRLGAARDEEADGQPSTDADGDGADEDGVTFGSIRVGQLDASVTVNVQNAPSGARLDAWIDFNGDGSWGGPGEQIADTLHVSEGANTLAFDVPSWAADGNTFARFRLSTEGDLGVGGPAADGEVEDYRLTINPPAAASGLFLGQNIISTAALRALSVFAADMDGDGDLDVLNASWFGNEIAWYENLSVATAADNYTVQEDQMLRVPAATGVLANDADLQGGGLSAVLDVDAQHGQLVLAADGSFTYLPEDNFFGIDSFSYRARSDLELSIVAIVTITVGAVNDPLQAGLGPTETTGRPDEGHARRSTQSGRSRLRGSRAARAGRHRREACHRRRSGWHHRRRYTDRPRSRQEEPQDPTVGDRHAREDASLWHGGSQGAGRQSVSQTGARCLG
jgi:hypothetical protein